MKKNYRIPILFLLPTVVLLLIFFYIPVVTALYISMTNFNMMGLTDWSLIKFVGIDNYIQLFQDPLFFKCVRNTLYFVILAVPFMIIIPLILAVLLNRSLLYFKNFYRIGYFLPYITEAVAISIVWRWFTAKDVGLVNAVLKLVGINGPGWLTDVHWAMPTIVAMAVWRSMGYNALLYLAGLQNVPANLNEVAELDGANSWQKFIYITVPLLRPTTFFITVTVIMGGLQLFAEPLTLTNGGPYDSTRSIVQFMYEQGFRYFNMGYAAAISYVLFALIALVTLVQFKFKDRDIGY